jgi:hypothetical protein
MIKKYLYRIIYVCSWICLNAFAFWYSAKCDSLELYDVFTLPELIVLVTSPIVSLIILSIGRFFYRQVNAKIEVNSSVKFKIFSFVLVSVLSLYYPISIIVHTSLNDSIRTSICQKSKRDHQSAHSNKLNYEEYAYIKNTNNLPAIPINSRNIDLFYYEDDFLGDYSIVLTFELDLTVKLTTTKRWKSEKWKVIKIDKVKKIKIIEYTDHQS